MSSMVARQRDVSSGRYLAYFSTNSEKVRRVGCMSHDFPQLSWPGEAGLGPRNCDELDLRNHLGRAFQALTVLSIIISQIADAAQTTRLTPSRNTTGGHLICETNVIRPWGCRKSAPHRVSIEPLHAPRIARCWENVIPAYPSSIMWFKCRGFCLQKV
jgi:hypothetical protein